MNRMTFTVLASSLFFLILANPLWAQADKELESRAQDLYRQIRCVVCEGQSLAGSQAPMARAMRARIRQALEAGKSNAEILQEFQNRYGDKVLMHPPVRRDTYLLWAAPFLILLIGGVMIRKLNAT